MCFRICNSTCVHTLLRILHILFYCPDDKRNRLAITYLKNQYVAFIFFTRAVQMIENGYTQREVATVLEVS